MAEVKDLENVEQEATAPAMEETAAERRPRGDARKPEGPVAGDPAEEAAPDHPPVHTGTAAGDRRGGAAESAGRQEQR